MAEVQEISEKSKEQEQEKRFNRQVNYFIMRYMWQVIRGRKKEDGNTIYAALDMSRERYTRVIDTGIIRFWRGELDSWHEITGIRKEIFTGEERFRCEYTLTIKGRAVKKEITKEDWEAWVKERIAIRQCNTTPLPKREKQQEICKRLKKVKRAEDNRDFYRLCYYLKYREAAPIKGPAETLRDISMAIGNLSFDLLNKSELGQLGKVQELLREKEMLVGAVLIYREAEKAERDKK